MNTDRIKEIQDKTGYPNNRTIQQALLQVWNETAQEYRNSGGTGCYTSEAVQVCEGWQQNHPEPLKDEGHYDIILDDGIIKKDVEYWAFGNGFDPCKKHESKTGGHYVNYPLEYVKYYRLNKPEV